MEKNSKIKNYILPTTVLAALCYVYYPVLKHTAEICWTNDDYSHGILLPFIAAYIIWTRKEDLKKSIDKIYAKIGNKISFSVVGLLLLLFGMVVNLMGVAAGGLVFIRWVSFFPALIGAMFLCLGRHVGMLFIPTTLLIFMARPIPDSMIPILFNPLQEMAAYVSAKVLAALSVPVYLQGNTIEIPHMTLLVEEACSGMRSVMALFTAAVIVLQLNETMKAGGKILVAALAIPIAIVLNVFRVASTGVLAHFYDKQAATGFFHTFSGLIVFVVGLLVLYGVATLIEKFSTLDNNTASVS